MFAEYGSDQSVVLSVNGTLTQSIIEDGAVRSSMNQGSADKLILDPISLAQYNKIAHAKERIMLAGSPQEASGANLRSQWTSSAVISMEPSRFLSGKTRPARARAGSPSAPSIATASPSDAASNLDAGTYSYFATACNERGESLASAAVVESPAAGEKVTVTITQVQAAKYYNVYRSEDGGSAASAKFIGRAKDSGASTTVFTDLGNREPGSVTGALIEASTMSLHQLAAYSRLKLALSDLSVPEAHYRFITLAVKQPRKNVIFENISGQLK
jgi:hypothetical protein